MKRAERAVPSPFSTSLPFGCSAAFWGLAGICAYAIANATSNNWTERAAVRVFNRFCGRTSNLNPAVVVFRGLRRPAVFRFYYAFQEARHGRAQYLERLEADMLAACGEGSPPHRG